MVTWERPGCAIVVSRTRPPAFLERLREETGVTLVPMGSAGAKAAAVIRGEADAYVHAAGSTSGIPRHRSPLRWPPGCMRPGWTARRWRYNQADPRCRIS